MAHVAEGAQAKASLGRLEMMGKQAPGTGTGTGTGMTGEIFS